MKCPGKFQGDHLFTPIYLFSDILGLKCIIGKVKVLVFELQSTLS